MRTSTICTVVLRVFSLFYIPIPIQTGMWRREPKYETKMTVMTFPISYMDAIMPEMKLGIS